MEVRDLHRWEVEFEEAREIQQALREKLVLTPAPITARFVAGADVSYCKENKKILVAAVVLMQLPGLSVVEEAVSYRKVDFPYVPGYLSFREAPPLIAAFRKLVARPDVILFDGQGIAHPRGLGLASHMGVILGIPSLGCAKKRLVGDHDVIGNETGSRAPLIFEGNEVGSVLRTKNGVKPVYVSPGHMIDTENAVDIVLRCLTSYRLPEPVRLAHLLTRKARDEEGGVVA